jgi:hypothetical protein
MRDITPSGKSNAMRAIVAESAPGRDAEFVPGRARAAAVRQWLSHVACRWLILGRPLDGSIMAKVDRCATTPDALLQMLRDVSTLIDTRAKMVGDGHDTSDMTDLYICYDEAAAIFTDPAMPPSSDLVRKILTEGPPVKVRSAFRSAPDRRLVAEYAELDTAPEATP